MANDMVEKSYLKVLVDRDLVEIGMDTRELNREAR